MLVQNIQLWWSSYGYYPFEQVKHDWDNPILELVPTWELLKKSSACFFGPFQPLPPIVVTFQTQYLSVKNVQGAKNPPVPEKTNIYVVVEKKPSNFKSTKKKTPSKTGWCLKP